MMGCLITHLRKLSALTPIECIEKLREIELILEKMQDKYSKEAKESKAMARKYAIDDQRVLAKACLRRVKMLENQMANLSARRAVCEQKRLAIEQINSVNMQVDAMQSTAQTFSVFLKQNDLDRITDLQENLQQAIIDTCDINEALSEELPLMASYDENDLEAELQTLLLNTNVEKNLSFDEDDFPPVATSPLPRFEESRGTTALKKKKRLAARVF